MNLDAMSIRDAFPFIRQVLSDAYKIDSHLFTHPYGDTGVIDRGFRKMLWGKQEIPTDFARFLANAPVYQMAVTKSTLGYYNIMAAVSLDWHHPDFISVGPFVTEKVTNAFVHRIISDQNLNDTQAHMAKKFYEILPVADIHEVVIMMQHLLSAFIPEFDHSNLLYLNYSEKTHEISPDQSAFAHFTSLSAQLYQKYLKDFLNALITGDYTRTSNALKIFLDANGTMNAASLYQLKRHMHELNTFCKEKLLGGILPPFYTLRTADAFSAEIERCTTLEQLIGFPYKMTRKYCLLVRNYSLADYSGLVRNVINYIYEHSDEEVTLSSIAAHFGKNASAFSAQFSKETGENVTTCIHRIKIATAIQLFNTTDLSVSEVASRVGIDNARYFSKLFREQIGMTPREYCKTMRS